MCVVTDQHDSHELLLACEHVSLSSHTHTDGLGYEAHAFDEAQLHGQVLTEETAHTHTHTRTDTHTVSQTVVMTTATPLKITN